jgi:hypothetical protein
MGEIKEVIKGYYKNKPPRITEGKYPSASMLGGCPRVAWCKHKGIIPFTPPNTNALQNFEVGNVTEAVIARALDNANILHSWWTDSQDYGATFNQKDWKGQLREDTWVDEELGVTGTPDLICDINGQKVLVDVKTASTKSTGYTISKIKKGIFWNETIGYKLQLACYMLLAKRRHEKGEEDFTPDYGKLVIIDKNVGSIIAEPALMYSGELEHEVKMRIEYLNKIFQEDSPEVVPCTCNTGWMKNWGSQYCDYGDITTIAPNSKKKLVPHSCCDIEQIKRAMNGEKII